MPKKGLLFGGDLFYDRLTSAGVSQGLIPFGNTVQFSISKNSEEKEIPSRGRADYGQVLHAVTIPGSDKITIKGNQWDESLVALFNLGTSVARDGAGGSVTDESVFSILDKYVELAYRDVSSVVVTDTTGTTTYVFGTDYDLDTGLGLLRALSGGAITQGEELYVDYEWAPETGFNVTPGVEPNVRLKLVLNGKNLETGDRCVVTVYDARVKPVGDGVDYMSEDFSEHGFEGTLTKPDGKESTYKIEWK